MKIFYKHFLVTVIFSAVTLFSNAQVVITQGFETQNPFLPIGWSLSPQLLGPQSLWAGTTGVAGNNNSPGVTPHGGSRVARFKAFNNVAGVSQSLITARIDYSGLGSNQAYFSFWMYRDSTSLNYDSLVVLVNTDTSIVTATRIGSVARCNTINQPDLVSANTWNYYSFNVPTSFITDTNYIILRGYGDAGKNIYIDDIEYDTYPPVCNGQPTVGNVAASITTICGGSGASIISSTASSYGESGLVFQWQLSDNPNGPWVDTLQNSITLNTGIISTPHYYRCYISCLSSGLSDTSSVVFVNVTNSPLPVLTITPVGTGPQQNQISFCVGTSGVDVAVTGANIYTWSPATGLSSNTGDMVTANPTINTTYTIVGTDNSGCSVSKTIVVTPRNPPNFTIAVSADTLCQGDSTTLTATNVGGGGGGTTYSWEPGSLIGANITVSPLANVNYVLTATNTSGCVKSDSVFVTVNQLPIATFSAIDITNPGIVVFTNTSSFATNYFWNFGDGDTSSIFNPEHNYPEFGMYNILLIASNNCGLDSITKPINIIGGISNIEQLESLTIQPNPAQEFISLKNGSNCTVEINSSNGQIVFPKFKVLNDTEKIDISFLSKGIYFIKVSSNKNNKTLKFVKG